MIETMSAAAIRRDCVGSLAGGKFPLLQWIGGSQGAGVFLTEWNEPAGKAIIKLIPADTEDAEARVSAWDAAISLSHPNLIEVYAHGRCEMAGVECLYVVTEFADEVLAEILKERPLSPDETRELLGPALDALSYLHGKGMVHGRLKPSNIMAAGDRLKLSTDGLSFAGAPAIPAATRTVYDAPEVADGTISPAADLWSLGATLVEALTQRPPQWDGLATSEPMVPQSVPQPFAVIARRCLRTDLARRGTIEAMQSRLDPAKRVPAKLEPSKASPDREEKTAGKMTPSRRRVLVLFAITTVLLAAIVIWNVLSHRKQPSAPPQQAQSLPTATPAPAPAPPAAQPNPAATSEEPPAPSQPASSDATSAPPQAPAPVTASVPAAAPPPQPQAQPQPQPQVDQTPAPTATTINPAIVNQILPDIVPSAMKTINGTLRVSIALTVGADGNVTSATLVSPGPSKYFAGKSLEAARHWKFKPAQVDGQSAPSSWTLEFQYKQSGIHVVAEPTAP